MIWSTDSFPTAKENMAHDEHLIEQSLDQHDPLFRLYQWPDKSSLTFTKGKALPAALSGYDHSERVTGGGIVFHAPKDLVFCVVIPKDNAEFPKGAKEKMAFLSNNFKRAFSALGIQLHSQAQAGPGNIQFCNAYHNPYELYFNNEKVLAIAMRKFRHLMVMQGVIHLMSTRAAFPELKDPAFQSFFTEGIGQRVSLEALLAELAA